VSEHAQGVFLWLDIVIKDIVRGARNKDTMDELRTRLRSMPGTIEGLYEQMLNRLEKLYFPEAIEYFRRVMANREGWQTRQLTLLEFACAEKGPSGASFKE
jgi:hypothetical protein